MLIETLNETEVNEFKEDLSEMFRIMVGINKAYSKSSRDFELFTKEFKSLINIFNKKYKNLQLELLYSRKEDEHGLGVFIKTDNLLSIFSEACSKITGLSAIGTEGFDEAGVTDGSKLNEKVKSITDKLFLSYMDPAKGANSFFIQVDNKKKMAEVVCSFEEFLLGPAFELCAHYALKSIDKKIDIQSKSSKFGFVDELTDQERRDWDKKKQFFGE